MAHTMTPEQRVGNICSMPLFQFKEEIMKLGKGELVGLAPLFPASWYSWPSSSEQAKAEFLITQLKHALTHRGTDIHEFIRNLMKR